MILGAYFGSKFAVQKGVGYVRTLFLLVTILLIGKMFWNILIFCRFIRMYESLLLYFKNLLILKYKSRNI